MFVCTMSRPKATWCKKELYIAIFFKADSRVVIMYGQAIEKVSRLENHRRDVKFLENNRRHVNLLKKDHVRKKKKHIRRTQIYLWYRTLERHTWWRTYVWWMDHRLPHLSVQWMWMSLEVHLSTNPINRETKYKTTWVNFTFKIRSIDLDDEKYVIMSFNLPEFWNRLHAYTWYN